MQFLSIPLLGLLSLFPFSISIFHRVTFFSPLYNLLNINPYYILFTPYPTTSPPLHPLPLLCPISLYFFSLFWQEFLPSLRAVLFNFSGADLPLPAEVYPPPPPPPPFLSVPPPPQLPKPLSFPLSRLGAI